MKAEVINKNRDCVFHGSYVGGDSYVIMLEDTEREFVVTYNTNIKPVSYFVGRETELQDLRQRIEDGKKSVLVSGMGGIGKTHICRKLFEEYLNKHVVDENGFFQHIGYIEYNGDISSSLQNCLKFKQQNSPEQNKKAAWRELEYLASDGKLLLFIDNVDKSINIDPGLQRLKSIPGAIVLTSRQASFGDEFELYPVGFLNMEQCKEIYEKIRFGGSERKTRLEEIQDLEYVIEKLSGRHTITIELLAHLARTKLWTIKKLREELEKKGFQLQFHKDGKFINIQKSYEALYDLSILTEAEKNILEAFSIFPYIPLSADMCNQWLLADARSNEEEDVLIRLYQKGWLQFDIDQEKYSLHPVFAQFIYEKCKPKIEKHIKMIESCQKSLNILENSSILECQKYIPFAENIIKKLDMTKEIKQVKFISTLAYMLQYVAEYKKSEKWYRISLEIYKAKWGENHPNTIINYNNLAYVYVSQGKYDKAEELYKKILEINERLLKTNHLDTASICNNLAELYTKQGEYDKAEKLYKKSLRIRKNILGKNHLDVASSYNNLAEIYASQGKYDKAEELYKESLRISENALGENHFETAISYNNLAYVYMSQGKYDKAEELYKKSVKINEKTLGENHPNTAYSYNNLAEVYEKKGMYETSKSLYEKSLKIIENILGENHPDTASIYSNIANLCIQQEEYDKAKKLHEKSLKIREITLREDHPDIVISYNNLAGVYIRQEEYSKAEELCEKGLRITERTLGENHLNITNICDNLAYVYEKQGKLSEAEELYKKSLKIRENVLGENHPDTLKSYSFLAGIYTEREEYDKAKELYKKSLRIGEEKILKDHLDVASNYNNLAYVYIKQRDYQKALVYFFKSYEIMFFKFGLNHPDVQTIYKNMQIVYFKLNLEDNFKQWIDEKMEESKQK